MFRLKLFTLLVVTASTTTLPVIAETNVETSCPNEFHQISVLPNAKYCQVFSNSPPASLTYHAAQPIEQTIEFYRTQANKPDSEQVFKNRTVFKYHENNKTVVISTDGPGSQIDILIKG